MRKVILKMSVSVDGFVAGPDGDASWIFDTIDDGTTAWEMETLWNAGVHIMGNRTFADMSAYWPTSDEPYAAPMNEIPKVVFSRKGAAAATTSSLEDAWRYRREHGLRDLPPNLQSWTEARVVTGDLADEIRRLTEEPGKPILAHGGASFAQSLVQAGLIDEYRLLVHPVAVGSGLPLFPPLAEPLYLQLVEMTSFPAGAIAKIYRPR